MNNAFCDVAEHPAMAVYRNVNPQHLMWNIDVDHVMDHGVWIKCYNTPCLFLPIVISFTVCSTHFINYIPLPQCHCDVGVCLV